MQRLVELHGGTVSATSVLGQGSEFTVTLPALAEGTAMAAMPSPVLSVGVPLRAGTGCRVLIVDDNLDAAEMLATLLNLSGHEVRMAFDGPAGLQAAREYPPDVILLDIGLPGLTGIEVAERIRSEPAFSQTVLVAMTGYGQEADRKRSREAGFDHHLTKPADFTELEKILAAVGAGPARAPLR